jgi:NADPH:quinone reductase-like Zn-dependent oxidoreductase
MGCHAEYRVLQQNQRVFPKPANLSFEEAASISFGGSTALHFLRKANLRAGETILVIGASGAVGSAIVQIANHFGAEVSAVTSAGNADLVKSLGALKVIDYRSENFSANGKTYDVIAETTGEHTFADCRNSLHKGGRFLAIAAEIPDMLATIWSSALYGKRVIAGPAEETSELIGQIGEWARAGILKPVIDRSYRFEQLPEAHAYVDTGRKRGSVVIDLMP